MGVGGEVEREKEAVHDILIKLFDEVFPGEDLDITVDLGNTLSKAVIVNTADKVSQEALSHTDIKNSEDDLEKIKNTGAKEAVTEVGKNQLIAGQSVRMIKFIFEKNILQGKIAMAQDTKLLQILSKLMICSFHSIHEYLVILFIILGGLENNPQPDPCLLRYPGYGYLSQQCRMLLLSKV